MPIHIALVFQHFTIQKIQAMHDMAGQECRSNGNKKNGMNRYELKTTVEKDAGKTNSRAGSVKRKHNVE